MNKKISVSLAITAALLAMTVTFSITMIFAMSRFDSQMQSVQEKENMYSKLSEVDKFVRGSYFGEIKDETLNGTIAYGYIMGLSDPNAAYYTATAYTELQNVRDGKAMGIGVDLEKDASGAARITKVYEDSPAERAEMSVGGFISAVDGNDVKGLTKDAVMRLLRGEAGTSVSVTYISPSNEEETVDITRAQYTVHSVISQMLENGRGYVKILSFNNNTPSELSRAVQQLTNNGAKGFVVDLRDNSGGMLEPAAVCIDMFCGEGITVGGEYANETVFDLYHSDAGCVEQPVVCLVDAETSGVAELFAIDLKDMIQAQIVGVRTAGKGAIISEPYVLSDGSAVVITIGSMLTDKGLVFDGVGLTPDVESILSAEEQQISYALTPDTDPQIRRGLEVLSGMLGEVGITDNTMIEPKPNGEEIEDPEQQTENEDTDENGGDEENDDSDQDENSDAEDQDSADEDEDDENDQS